MQKAEGIDKDEWEYALWTSLALELLARAALSNISPILLAENERTWSHLYNALGFDPIEGRYSPRSVAISEVLKRLSAILPDFLKEHEAFGVEHTGRRNAELHSGERSFDGIKSSSWQPRYYETCQVLLKSMGAELEDFVSKDEAKVARELIEAAADESAKAVLGDVSAHKKVWEGKSDDERTTLSSQALLWATRQTGHRVHCPSCKNISLVFGEPVSSPSQTLEDDMVVEKTEYLPNRFECVACQLKISGYSRLNAVELGERFVNTVHYDAAEYFAPDDDYHLYEEDYNE